MDYRVRGWQVKDDKLLPEGGSDMPDGVVGPYLEIPKNVVDGMEKVTGTYVLQNLGGGYFHEPKTDRIFERVGGTDDKPDLREIKYKGRIEAQGKRG